MVTFIATLNGKIWTIAPDRLVIFVPPSGELALNGNVEINCDFFSVRVEPFRVDL